MAVIFALVALSATPIESKFLMHLGELDLRFSLSDITIAFTNKLHLINYGILALLLLNYLLTEPEKYTKTFWYTFGFAALVEVTQIFFVDGHFRLRDFLSNAVGITIASRFFKVFEVKLRTASPGKKFLLNLVLVIIQVVMGLILYYLFKEISVKLGGESLRKYL